MALSRSSGGLRNAFFPFAGYLALAGLLSLPPAAPAQAGDLSAAVDWAQRLEVGTLVGGSVTATFAEVGDRVARDAALMQIDPAPYLLKVQAAEARVKTTGVDYERIRRHHKRQEELYDLGSLSTVQLDESAFELSRAESAHDLAKAELALARYDLDKTTTRAPVDAWVADKRVFVGQSLSVAQVVPVSFVLVPAGKYLAVSAPPPATRELPAVGTAVEVEVYGRRYQGTVAFPQLSADLGAVRLTVSFDAGDALILPGTPATLTLPR